LALALILFVAIDHPITQFRIMMGIVLCGGSCTSLFYMCTIKEVRLTKEADHYDALYKAE